MGGAWEVGPRARGGARDFPGPACLESLLPTERGKSYGANLAGLGREGRGNLVGRGERVKW